MFGLNLGQQMTSPVAGLVAMRRMRPPAAPQHGCEHAFMRDMASALPGAASVRAPGVSRDSIF